MYLSYVHWSLIIPLQIKYHVSTHLQAQPLPFNPHFDYLTIQSVTVQGLHVLTMLCDFIMQYKTRFKLQMMPLDIHRFGKNTHDIVQMHISIMQ